MKINKNTFSMTAVSFLMLTVITFGIVITPASSLNPEVFLPEVDISVTATATQANESIWMLPGPRSLDPAIFGTPAEPLKTNWLPVSMRNTTQDGTAYTTTSFMTPFSNNTKSITGSLSLSVKDITEIDTPSSLDEASVDVNFTDPTGLSNYRVVLTKLLPVGPDHKFFGGVGINTYMHGETEIGTPLMPASLSFVTLWGLADLYINGTKVDSNRVLHLMVSQRMRTQNLELGFGVADPNQVEIHVIMPNTKVDMTTGPFDSPVPTQFILPNGAEQPFLHVNFYNIVAERSSPSGSSTLVQTEDGVTTTTTPTTSPGFTGYVAVISFFAIILVYNFKRKRN
jgi:hypothetical protein